ncbi:MAG TPA: UDP-N-acetylglucosamine 2-epimerase (non-hydrolyzing) [Candidatus Magasanikbacteria bacterium]|nr:UDP-N-acetylglucosamine 2-epimerase (non-hydrolyzing) [Candidatus Magasanikbacteria bacterium]
MKIAYIVGTRPEIIKLYSLIKESKISNLDFFIIHTNQHYDEKMDKIFFDELELPQPKYNLNIGSGPHGDQTGRMLIKIEKILKEERPGIVFVQGDTNTVLSGALAASKLFIKIGHVEAGLRSYDKTMPEEINRIITDHISDYLFCPTKKQKQILLKEGIDKNKIIITGNTIVDAVYDCVNLAESKSKILSLLNIEKNNYFFLTCHRPSNTDDKNNINEIMSAISSICVVEKIKCIFPVHPRLKNKIEFLKSNDNFIMTEPLCYTDSLLLQKNSKMIFTDSGGIQEESCILQKKCIILRLNTERPETVDVGGAVLLNKMSKNNIVEKYNYLINKNIFWYNPFGDGFAYKNILNSIQS